MDIYLEGQVAAVLLPASLFPSAVFGAVKWHLAQAAQYPEHRSPGGWHSQALLPWRQRDFHLGYGCLG